MYILLCVHSHAPTHTHTDTHTHIYIYIYIYTYTHTHTRTHTHTATTTTQIKDQTRCAMPRFFVLWPSSGGEEGGETNWLTRNFETRHRWKECIIFSRHKREGAEKKRGEGGGGDEVKKRRSTDNGLKDQSNTTVCVSVCVYYLIQTRSHIHARTSTYSTWVGTSVRQGTLSLSPSLACSLAHTHTHTRPRALMRQRVVKYSALSVWRYLYFIAFADRGFESNWNQSTECWGTRYRSWTNT